MKIILTGATGFVGSVALARLVANDAITGVTCLTRRPIDAPSPKVTMIVHDDFAVYDGALLERLADHVACIWTLGGKASELGTPDAYTRVTHTFTLALAEGMAGVAARPFTFCYLSGMGADPTETAWLPWERLTRHVKGRTEKDLAGLQEREPRFCAHAFRPGGILPLGASAVLRTVLRTVLAPIVVAVGELADAMIVAATEPTLFRRQPVVHNADIKRLARRTA